MLSKPVGPGFERHTYQYKAKAVLALSLLLSIVGYQRTITKLLLFAPIMLLIVLYKLFICLERREHYYLSA
jgi:hypothetical protein